MAAVFVAGAAWTMMSGSPDAAKKTTKKTITPHSASAGTTVYTDADYKATYASYDGPLKNAFKPLIARRNTGGDFGTGKENGVPAYMAGGSGDWIYTGTAVVDGVPTALIENTATGDGVYLNVGEHWKELAVEHIESDSIVIRSSDGETVSLRLAAPVGEDEIRPLTPGSPLQGEIGGQMSGPTVFSGQGGAASRIGGLQVTPDATASDAAAPAAGSGRRGRNRSANVSSG